MSLLVIELHSNSGDCGVRRRIRQSGPDMERFKWLAFSIQLSSLLRERMSFGVSSVESDFGVVAGVSLGMGVGSVLFGVLVSSDVLDVKKLCSMCL